MLRGRCDRRSGRASCSLFDTLADQVLAAHMIQHIIIGDVCSLLIVLGLTGPILAPVLRLRVSRPLWRLTSPLIALTLWVVDLYAWHLPITYQLAIRHDSFVHALEHACMLWFGILLWMALLGPLRKPAWFGGWARVWCVISVQRDRRDPRQHPDLGADRLLPGLPRKRRRPRAQSALGREPRPAGS